MDPLFALLPTLGPVELGVISLVTLLLFGNRLPSVMRSMGKSIVEFKRGLADTGSETQPEVAAPQLKS